MDNLGKTIQQVKEEELQEVYQIAHESGYQPFKFANFMKLYAARPNMFGGQLAELLEKAVKIVGPNFDVSHLWPHEIDGMLPTEWAEQQGQWHDNLGMSFEHYVRGGMTICNEPLVRDIKNDAVNMTIQQAEHGTHVDYDLAVAFQDVWEVVHEWRENLPVAGKDLDEHEELEIRIGDIMCAMDLIMSRLGVTHKHLDYL